MSGCYAAWLAGFGSRDRDGDEAGDGCCSVACLSHMRSPSDNDRRLIGHNGMVSRAFMRHPSRASLTSSEVQLAVQAKMHRQEMK